MIPPPYAELHALSNFTFLRGASHPEELVEQAAELGYSALALTDECTMSGIVRGHMAAKQAGVQFIVGARLDFSDGGPSALCFPTDRAAYARMWDLGLVVRPIGESLAMSPPLTITESDIAEIGDILRRGLTA